VLASVCSIFRLLTRVLVLTHWCNGSPLHIDQSLANMVSLLLQHDTAETKGYVQGAVDTVVGGVQLDLAAAATAASSDLIQLASSHMGGMHCQAHS
jgi:hypothetical protein